jgi:DNA invertase Pin-like site-specific DNA recombinase
VTNVLGYVRVSTHEQAMSGLGLAAQRSAIEAACSARGWALRAVVDDDGASGRSLDRPGIQEALRGLLAGTASCLMVSKLDRLTRSVGDLAALVAWTEANRLTLVALDLGVDTSTPGGRLIANVFASVAEWEREMAAARTTDALAALRAQGRPISRPAVVDVDGGRLAQRIAAMRSSGLTYQGIADTLNAEGQPTLRGASSWGVSAVRGACGYQRPPRARQAPSLPVRGRRLEG